MPRRGAVSTPRGPGLFVDRLGHRYGRLVVISRAESDRQGARWLCRCDCGRTKEIQARLLSRGEAHTCGCGPRGHRPGGGPLYTQADHVAPVQRYTRRAK